LSQLVFERSEGAALIKGSEIFTSFCSTDFLGFSQDNRVFQAVRDGLSRENELLTGRRDTCGARPYHQRLAKGVSAFRASEEARLFSSFEEMLFALISNSKQASYSNVFISSSIQRQVCEGFSFAGLELSNFDSAEPDQLEEKLSRVQNSEIDRKALVLIESLSPINGRVAPLRAFLKVCEKAQATMLVDDSFGLGVLGLLGSGGLEKAGILDEGVTSFFDFKHTLGSVGAAVVGSRLEVEGLLGEEKDACLLPLYSVYGVEAALELTELEVRSRSKLRAKALRVRDGLISMGLRVEGDPVSPVILIKLEDPLIISEIVRGLFERKIVVDKDSSGVRIIIRSIHTPALITALLQAVDDVGKKLGLISSL
jgi:glycine C-acetyltransferase